MKFNYRVFRAILMFCLIVFLYTFSSARNSKRVIDKVVVEFQGENTLFLTKGNVSKLLIQNDLWPEKKQKEMLVLGQIEKLLENNDKVRKAEVFSNLSGSVVMQIEQNKPIARIIASPSFYIDSQGGVMSLSYNYTERVPLFTGDFNKENFEQEFVLLEKIHKDSFFNKMILSVHKSKEHNFSLNVRGGLDVELGGLDNLKKKLTNFKGFYKKASNDKILSQYKSVNLKFDNQVICTKK